MEVASAVPRFDVAVELVSRASRFREPTLNVHIQVSVRFSFQGPRQASGSSLVVPALGSRSLVTASLFVNTFFLLASFFFRSFRKERAGPLIAPFGSVSTACHRFLSKTGAMRREGLSTSRGGRARCTGFRSCSSCLRCWLAGPGARGSPQVPPAHLPGRRLGADGPGGCLSTNPAFLKPFPCRGTRNIVRRPAMSNHKIAPRRRFRTSA